MKKKSIPTLIGIILLVLGLIAGVFLVKNQAIFRLGATASLAPKDVRFSNLTDNSFTISWTTDKETSGFIKWGKEKENLDKTELDEIKNQSLTHSVTLRSLTPQTQYFARINSGGEEFDNNGLPWEATTAPTLQAPSTNLLISGQVLNSTGESAKNALVYVTTSGGETLSTLTSEGGSWVIPISLTRTSDLTSYLPINNQSSLIEISVNAGGGNVASAQIYPQSAHPVPPIILGQVHDFKSLPPSTVGEIPQAELSAPPESSPSSGFKVEEGKTATSSGTVTLESIKNDNEVITSTKPEFFGVAPKGTDLTITVESDPVTDTVKASANGEWNWSPPEDLAPGVHKITISWRDINGILRTLTRTFIVEASEGPAFESTPSASLTPTPTATVTPRVTSSPTPTASSSGQPTARPSSSPTLAPTPVSGSLTPTLLLSIMGIGVILFAFLLWQEVTTKP